MYSVMCVQSTKFSGLKKKKYIIFKEYTKLCSYNIQII